MIRIIVGIFLFGLPIWGLLIAVGLFLGWKVLAAMLGITLGIAVVAIIIAGLMVIGSEMLGIDN